MVVVLSAVRLQASCQSSSCHHQRWARYDTDGCEDVRPLNYGHAARPPRWSLWRFRLLILLINQRLVGIISVRRPSHPHILLRPLSLACMSYEYVHVRIYVYVLFWQNEGNSKITLSLFEANDHSKRKKIRSQFDHELLCPCLPDRRHRSVISSSVPCPVAGPGRRHDRRIFRIFGCRRRWIDG